MENEGTTLKAAKREFMSWKSSTKQALIVVNYILLLFVP